MRRLTELAQLTQLTRLALAAPGRVLFALAGVTLLLGSGASRSRTEFGYRPLVGADHPAIERLESFVERFAGGFPVRIAWRCGEKAPCDDPLDPASLEMAHAVASALAVEAGVRSVQGPATSTLLVPGPDGFAVRRLVEHGRVAPDLGRLAAQARRDPLWRGEILSEDASTGVIVAQLADSSSETSEHVVRAVERALEPWREAGFDFHLVGHAVEFVVAGSELAESSARLVPITALVVALVVWVLSRSLGAVALTMGTMGVALVWTFGLLGWLGWPRDAILQTLAPLILVVGVCDAIHVLSRYAEELARRDARTPADRADALMNAVRDTASPCLVTTLTTAGALASFATSDLETFVRFGVISSFGVVACLVLTFGLLPIGAVRLRVGGVGGAGAPPLSHTWRVVLEAVARTAERRAVPILVVGVLVLLVCGLGWATRLRVDTDGYEMYGRGSRIITWIRFFENEFGRSDDLEIEVALPEGVRLGDPGTLESVAAFTAFLEGEAQLGETRSILDLLARLNRLLHDDDPAFDHPAPDPAANVQLLELASFEHPDAVSRWLTLDQTRLRLSVEAPFLSFTERGRVLARIDDWAAAHLPEGWRISLTGPFSIGFDWVADVQRTQLRSFGTAFGLVLALVAVFLRSPRLGVVALVPTLLPVVAILGVMGFAGLSLDVGRAMIAAVVIGIAVDDAVHLLAQYRGRRALGEDVRGAMRGALLHVGRAVVTTSLALALGFLTLLASPWQTVSSFGGFVALAVLGALAADLFVLPALVFVCARRALRERVAMPRPGSSQALERTFATSAVLLLVGIALALAASGRGPGRELACWVLPNGLVSNVLGAADACPLASDTRVWDVRTPDGNAVAVAGPTSLAPVLIRAGDALEVRAGRGSEPGWTRVPVWEVPAHAHAARLLAAAGLAGLLLFMPLLLLWRSSSPAAPPFALFYGAVATLAVALICGRGSEPLQRMGLIAVLLAPSVLFHLALTFPRERRVLRQAPALRFVPYAASLLLAPVAWMAFDSQPVMWPALRTLVLVLLVGAWLVLVFTCGFALRESDSALERARARVLWYGTLGVLVATALALPVAVPGPHAPERVLAVWAVVWTVGLPVPIGLAISRYRLFDLEEDARRWIARFVYLALAAAVVTGGLVVGDGARPDVPGLLLRFTLVFGCLAVLEPVRRHTLGILETLLSPRLRELTARREVFSESMGELRDREQVARELGETLERVLRPLHGAVFLPSGAGWLAAHRFGVVGTDGPPSAALLNALARLGPASLHRLSDANEAPTRGVLETAGVELVMLLRRGSQTLGVVLLAARADGSPWSGVELDFLRTVAGHAALALHNAGLANELLRAERRATTGRLSLALAHDVGKELDWIRRLARRLADGASAGSRPMRDLGVIQELAEGLSTTLRRFVRDAARPDVESPERMPLDLLLDRAVRAAERRHGRGLVLCLDPRARRLRTHQDVEIVVRNLLDNAVLAGPDETVRVHASLTAGGEGPALCIRVCDRGPGIPPPDLGRVFEWGFTTRSDAGGCGAGLSLCREIVERLGGRLELASGEDGGTRATVVLPLDRPERTQG